jgi:hypothetical protein
VVRRSAKQRSGHAGRTQIAHVTRRTLEQSALYSEKLGINLAKCDDAACFRWFLASLLFGARISETIAENTYRRFVHHGLTSPQRIVEAGWDFLVFPVMREGGYVRYDGRKSTQVLRDSEKLIADYGGSLRRLHEEARDANDLEQRLLAFYGVGPVTMNIFLRELRPFWAKADPDPLPAVRKLAKYLPLRTKDLGVCQGRGWAYSTPARACGAARMTRLGRL